jgi:tetratricopeptide (TPR) repeat protein
VAQETLREINLRRRAQQFVGRTEQILAFSSNLSLPIEERRYIWNLHGQGGIGKTTLLKRLLEIARDEGALTAFADESLSDAVDVMASISKALHSQEVPLKNFEERHRRFLEILKQVQGDPDLPSGIPTIIGRTLGRVGIEVARQLPFGSGAVSLLGQENIVSKLGEYAEFIAKKINVHDDVELMLKPTDVLTPLFISDLNKYTSDKIIVIGFDTYEKTSDYLDQWLRHILDGRFGDLSANVLMVIAGREKLSDQWADFLELLHYDHLDVITEEEARRFLAARGIHEDHVVELILKLSGRIPLWLATLASQSPKGVESVNDPTESAIERFLKWVNDDQRRKAALVCALPRRLDVDSVAVLCGREGSRSIFDWLRTQPFVESKGDSGWAYHDVVRRMMLRYLRVTSHEEWKLLNLSLADYYQGIKDRDSHNKNDAPGLASGEPGQYHRLLAQPDEGLVAVIKQFFEALFYKRSLARVSAELVLETGDLLGRSDFAKWGEQMHSTIAVYYTRKWLEALTFYDFVDREFATETYLLSVTAAERAKAYAWLDKDEEALRQYGRAISINPNESRFYAGRAEVFLRMKNHLEAIADYKAALKLSPRASHLHEALARALQRIDQLNAALDAYTNALECDPSNAWLLSQRAEVFADLDLPERALSDLSTAIDLSPMHFRYAQRAHLLHLMERSKEALDDLTHAIESRDMEDVKKANREHKFEVGDKVWIVGPRDYEGQKGLIYADIGEMEKALNEFAKAIAFGERAPFYMWKRARLLREAGDSEADINWRDAELAMTRTIECSAGQESVGNSVEAFAERAEFYLDWGRLEESLADCDEAGRLAPQDSNIATSRAMVLHRLGRSPEALHGLTSIIDEDPPHGPALALRINILSDLGRYDEAVADIDRALSLRGFDRENLRAARGRRLAYLGRYEEACNDFEAVGLGNLTMAYYHAISKARSRGANNADHEIGNVRALLPPLLAQNEYYAFYVSGGLHAVEGNHRAALEDLEHALRNASNREEANECVQQALIDPAWLPMRENQQFRSILSLGGQTPGAESS